MDSQEKALQQGLVGEGQQSQETAEAVRQEETQTVENTTECCSSEKGQVEVDINTTNEATSSDEENVLSASASQDTTSEVASSQDEEPVETEPLRINFSTRQELLAHLEQMAKDEHCPTKDEVERIKGQYYRLLNQEREQQVNDFLEQGGAPEDYQMMPDETEAQFKHLMQVVRERRTAFVLQQEEERQANLKRKLEILERIKEMATSPEEANRCFNDFKALQQEWKEIKNVPAPNANDLWRNYQLYVEQFYDQLHLNREAREYDFKRNLEMKQALCEAAEKLVEEKDVIAAFRKLQDLHAQYREIGPVERELRETVWARFKAASTVINKAHQQYFDDLRAKEEENLQKKTALCEQVEAIVQEERRGAGDWEKHSQAIIALQQEWKTVGFASKKMNDKVYERFRAACDDFFQRKAEFFKEFKAQMSDNVSKKRALVDEAKALTDSTEWKATGERLAALQQEWRTIGVVPRKVGDKLWKEFMDACNHFYDARKAQHAGQRTEENENLKKKRDIIAQVQQLLELAEEEAKEKLSELSEAFQQIGHVPFRDKDKVYHEFREAVDAVYDKFRMARNSRRMDNFRQNLKTVAKRGEEAVDGERARLTRKLEQLKQDINTYENNLGFLSVASKKGNSLVDEMKRRVQKLKDEADLLRTKIHLLDTEANSEE